ncbi:MAG: bifunctional nuclease family protein [Chitinophagales bacterium]|nr:bifunctional nuclease family protein [Chitinophagales bacterium]
MNRIQLEVVTIGEGVTSSQTAFNVILKEKFGTRKMIVVISMAEAQSIAISLNIGLNYNRVMTHELFYKVCKTFNVELLEVNINNLKEGIYYTTTTFQKNDKIEDFDARISDALALALKYNCPIYINSELFNSVAYGNAESGNQKPKQTIDEFDKDLEDELKNLSNINIAEFNTTDFKKNTLAELKEMLENALQNENYELAAKLRDEIDKRS